MSEFKISVAEMLKDSKFMREVVKQYFSEEYFEDWLPKHTRKLNEAIERQNTRTMKYYWIKISAPKDQEPLAFLAKIQELQRYAWFKNVVYNIEFNPHLHSHILIRQPSSSLRPARIIEQASKWVGVEPNLVYCRYFNHSYQNRYNYVLGDKIPEHKKELVEKDKLDRQEHNIENYYSA